MSKSTKINNTILLNRSLLMWEWYDDINTTRLWIHLLLRVNWKDHTEKGIKLKRGELLTSIKSLSNETGLSVTSIRTSIDKLKLTNNITSKSTNKYRIIKVIKYDDYQLSSKQNNKQTDKQNDKQNENKTTTDNIYNTINQDNQFNIIKDIIEYLNQKTGSKYKHTTRKTKDSINARINEGFTIEDFKTVINKKHQDWNGTEYYQYMRPETLFGTKFESYLNQKVIKKDSNDIELGWDIEKFTN